MDLNIQAESVEVSTTRNSGRVNVYLNDVDTRDLLSQETLKEIGVKSFVEEFGADEVFNFLKSDYPELFNQAENN
jgi:hypothetical protein